MNKLIQKIIRPSVLEDVAYQVPDASGMVKLDAMENPYRLPEILQIDLAEHLSRVPLNRYPIPTYRALKEKMQAVLGVPSGFDLLLGNGSDELIGLLIMASAQPGTVVLAPIPTFVMYERFARHLGATFIGVPLADNLCLDKTAMLEAIERHQPAWVFLSNPNNPTGGIISVSDIITILNAMENIGFVVVDEAYEPFTHTTIMPYLPYYSHLVVMRTVSKLGLAGVRLGYLSAADALLSELEKIRPPYNINVLTAATMMFLLNHMTVLKEQAEHICAQRQYLINKLQEYAHVTVYPSEANFILIRVLDVDKVMEELKNRHILVKNVSHTHPLLTNCLRITVGTEVENRLLLHALTDIFLL